MFCCFSVRKPLSKSPLSTPLSFKSQQQIKIQTKNKKYKKQKRTKKQTTQNKTTCRIFRQKQPCGAKTIQEFSPNLAAKRKNEGSFAKHSCQAKKCRIFHQTKQTPLVKSQDGPRKTSSKKALSKNCHMPAASLHLVSQPTVLSSPK